jgi:hypothetical protein
VVFPDLLYVPEPCGAEGVLRMLVDRLSKARASGCCKLQCWCERCSVGAAHGHQGDLWAGWLSARWHPALSLSEDGRQASMCPSHRRALAASSQARLARARGGGEVCKAMRKAGCAHEYSRVAPFLLRPG